MKRTFYILLTIGNYNSGLARHDYIVVEAQTAEQIDCSTMVIDGVQLTFNESSVDAVGLVLPKEYAEDRNY